ncbi:MAG: RNB domain-containing ribonuclease, partial [Spirochaetia bacterium]|nr:RNB domain-containing ribonuclease [Spirochaetia bacterium]
VKRLSYRKAEELKESPELKPLFEIARKNVDKRNKAGAVQITMPEVHIYVDRETKKVSVVKDEKYESNEMIRELMLLAGEGAAKFAFQNNIPFPYVSQEEPQIPDEIPEGLAGQFRLRRCMRKRSVGVTPGMHCGLGLHMYSQVTSPLRRYGDLISHQQLRAFIDGRKLLDKDTMLMRISEGDAGAMAARKSERNSNLHWTLVYLLQNPEWTGDAVCVSHAEGKLPQFCIPELAQEAFFDVPGGVELNQTVKVKVSRINLPELQVEFMVAQ